MWRIASASRAIHELGSVWEPDYEAINALEPDLIVVAGRSSRIYPDMKEIAPTADLARLFTV